MAGVRESPARASTSGYLLGSRDAGVSVRQPSATGPASRAVVPIGPRRVRQEFVCLSAAAQKPIPPTARCSALLQPRDRDCDRSHQRRVIAQRAQADVWRPDEPQMFCHDTGRSARQTFASPQGHTATQDDDGGRIDGGQIPQSLPQIPCYLLPLRRRKLFGPPAVDPLYPIA